MSSVALVAIQLEVNAEVLASPQAYRAHIDDVAACALEDAAGADHRVLVFPELAGHLALLALAPASAQRAPTLARALAASAVRRPLDVLRGVASARTLGPRHAVLAALAPDGERYWRQTFAPLAKRHAAYVVAGSHLRLAPDGDLTNATLVFDPEGRAIATFDKVNLVAGTEDLAPGAFGLARGDRDRAPIVDAPGVGALAVAIGYDRALAPRTTTERFHPMPPAIAAAGGAAILANPIAHRIVGGGADGALFDDGELAAATAASGARTAVAAHLVGRVLELAFAGASAIVARDAGTGAIATLARAGTTDQGGHLVRVISPGP